ncbi:MAG: DMT family transporter [Hyphomicrobiales bacterium]
MTRLQANAIVLLVALIWGTTFVVQHTGMDDIDPCFFTGIRFFLGMLVVLPLSLREIGRLREAGVAWSATDRLGLVATGLALFCGSIMQQIGITTTTVTNAAFFTALYVPTVPILALVVSRIVPHPMIWPGAALCVAGAYMLGGAQLSALGRGDVWVMGGALFWACQIVLVGVMTRRTNAPFTIAAAQSSIAAIMGLLLGGLTESFSLEAVYKAGFELLYAGVLSAGIAFTLQCLAQKYTQAADAAIIMSFEAVFAAIAGALFLGERLTPPEYGGCMLILVAVVAIQLLPLRESKKCPEDKPDIPHV